MNNTRLNRKEIVLTDGNVSLRPYDKKDADELYRGVRESLAELAVWMSWAHEDYSIRESRDWLKKKPEEWRYGFSYDFAIFDSKDSSYLGGCGFNRIDHECRTANLGYWVRTGRTSQGVATSATLLLTGFGFKELGFNRIEILVATDNKSSLRVAEKAGARREGILRNRILVREKVHDAVMFSLIPGDVK